MKKKIIGVLFVFLFFSVLLASDVNALTNSSLKTMYVCDSSTGWKYSTQNFHMDSKNTSYYIYSESLRTAYKGYFEGGVGEWGNNVSVSYSSSGRGYITEELDYSETRIASVKTNGNSNGITTSWVLTINKVEYDKLSSDGKEKIMAHELGHVYGLGDLYGNANYNKIMCYGYNHLMTVTADDIMGMKVVTGVHRHTGSYSKEYEMISLTNHKARCTTCKTYYIESHTGSGYCSKCGFSW